MALIDKLVAIGNGFRSSRGTTQEYTLDEMAVLAAEKTGGSDDGSFKAVIERTATEITLPSDLTSIGGYVFYYCSKVSGDIIYFQENRNKFSLFLIHIIKINVFT